MKSLVSLLIKKIKKLDTTEKENAQLKKHAQKSALEIIEQANRQALDILSKATIDKQTLDLEMTNQYKQALNEVKNDTINIFKQNMQQEILTELNAYKERKLSEIDDAVYKIASHAAKEVLGKTLSFDQHEELIIKALEDAKHDGLFS